MDYSILSRSYDLRGVYGVDIDEDFFFRLGYAFVQVLGKSRIALGYDARLSSPVLKEAFTRGAHLAGATIIDIWLCSSDMLSFATCHYDDIEAGVMITASHNPKEYNWLKCLGHSWEPYNFKKYWPEMVQIMDDFNPLSSRGDGGLALLKDQSSVSTASNLLPVYLQGRLSQGALEHRDILDDWIWHILSFVWEEVDFSSYTIIADGGNGAAGAFMWALSQKAGFRMIPLFLEPDGNFPHHHPNPMHAKNREDAKKALIAHSADVALIFDGDADRVILLDEKWDQVNSAVISAAIVELVLSREPDAKFIGNAVTSHNYRDFVWSKGSEYIREKVGHVYIRETMMGDKAIAYAGEHSAHYFFRDNYFMDSGIVAAMVFLSLAVWSGKKISEFTSLYARYITLEETNFRVDDPKKVIEKLTEIYKYEKYDLYDWITVEYSDGSWWNFRPSSNEPLLRFNLEAKTQDRFDSLYGEILTFLEQNGARKVDE